VSFNFVKLSQVYFQVLACLEHENEEPAQGPLRDFQGELLEHK
jgi:hypothetical protein